MAFTHQENICYTLKTSDQDGEIQFLYAKGLTTREIVDTCQERYGADVSASLISKVTDRVIGQVIKLAGLIYSGTYMENTAKSLNNGENHSIIYDLDINWRALRRIQIQQLESTPDVIVTGGSRWQEASRDLLPAEIGSFMNVHGHSDYNEDFFAVTHLLETHNRLPKTLILSLRYEVMRAVV